MRKAATLMAVVLISSGAATSVQAQSVPAIAAGWYFTCAVAHGGVQCWGLQGTGLDYGPLPVPVSGLTSGVTAITAGAYHACAVMSGGAWCWGSNSSGQLGNGSTTYSAVPVQVSGLGSGVQAISAGSDHTCAIVNGGAWCWGYNVWGQLGDGTTTTRLVPVQVRDASGQPLTGVTAIAAGGNSNYSEHTCAVVDGAVQCWGRNSYGQLGDGSPYWTQSSVPVQVAGLASGGQDVATGIFFTCGVANGGVRCWGLNNFGDLGDCGGEYQSNVPVQVTGLTSGGEAVSASNSWACAIVNGGVLCWGYNTYGELGNDSTQWTCGPVQASGLTSGATDVTQGYLHTCAVVDDRVWCWGYNYQGQLGTGTQIDSHVPVPVCLQGYDDCDGNAANGCETDLWSDVDNCGGCGSSCAPPHAAAQCVNATCAVGSCDPGHYDCDGLPANGCEAVVLPTWHRDADGDGFGDPGVIQAACTAPPGYVPNGADCDDADPASWTAPLEVAGLLASTPGAGVLRLAWTSQSGVAGTGTAYEVVTGVLSALLQTGSFSGSRCLVNDDPASFFDDDRSGPSGGTVWYYLVRAGNSCGKATHGDSSILPDPRDALDASSPCP